jgi:hypothetical protein
MCTTFRPLFWASNSEVQSARRCLQVHRGCLLSPHLAHLQGSACAAEAYCRHGRNRFAPAVFGMCMSAMLPTA